MIWGYPYDLGQLHMASHGTGSEIEDPGDQCPCLVATIYSRIPSKSEYVYNIHVITNWSNPDL